MQPAIQVHYRASKVKQYFKEGRALRTETTVNDTRDFGIGRRLTAENWQALIDIGHGLRFDEPRTMALLACLCGYQHLCAGLTNRSLRGLISTLIPGYGARQMTYDLRRLRRKGFIQRIPRTQRYELTTEGRRLAVFFSKTYTRIVNPALAQLDPALPDTIPQRSALARSWQAVEAALDQTITNAALT